jgi:outer membrane receptor protein involved in Fe transport
MTWMKATLLGASTIAIAAFGPAYAEEADMTADNGDAIIVTAQRRAENILQVPISVTSYSTEKLDSQGVRGIEDIARLTPSLRFTRTAGVSGNNGTNISLRGIASDVGSATTAIYIDDTPIQIRSIGYFSGNPYPKIFDLERVEVLRGPQGTLFGSSAEGGAVRFITPQPSFTDFSVYSRAEVATTDHGDESYEVGFATGGPVSNTLAVRASAWYRRDGGYIDRINPTTRAVVKKDANSQDSMATKIALTWKPVETLTITPSIYYQNVTSDAREQFWEGYGNPGDLDYVNGAFNQEPARDRFALYGVNARLELGDTTDLTYNGSYFDRDQYQVLDYSNFQATLRSGNPFGTYANQDKSNATAAQTVKQKNWTQELRIQSKDDDRLFDWSAGVYYSRTKQLFNNLSASGRLPGVISSGFPQYLGRYNLNEDVNAKDEQYAAFLNVDLKPAEGLKITLAGRVTHSTFDYVNSREGPVAGGAKSTFGASQKATTFTPKAGVSYQVDADNMIYASVSKGFRPGGAQSPVDPTFCGADLRTLGITSSPTDYASDSLWSYEVGTKNRMFGGKLTTDVNAYLIKWSNIQQSVRLPQCANSYIGNLGDATSKGFDVSLAFNLTPNVQFGGSLGYNDTTYDDDVFGGAGVLIRAEGDRIGGPKLTGSAYTQLKADLSESTEGYFRADYTFASSGIDPTRGTFGYDAGLPGLPSTDYLTLRAGVKLNKLDLSAFVNNVTNSRDPLSRSHDGIGSPLYYVESYRPRTMGLTARYSY